MDQQELTPQERQQQQLQQLLSEAITAERFFEQDTGRLWTQLCTFEINRLIGEITSDKFDKDHIGYMNSKTELKVWRKMLRKMQVAGAPQRRAKIEEKLEFNGQSE
jgi:hypothetical protein